MNSPLTLYRKDGSEFQPILPSWFDLERGRQQFDIAQSIAECYFNGAGVVLLEASTGIGKSGVSEIVRQILSPPESISRMLFATPFLGLQDQLLATRPEARLIRGRKNFPHGLDTHKRLFPAQTCSDCRQHDLCEKLESSSGSPYTCPYKVDRKIWEESELGVATLQYFLTVANYRKMIQIQRQGVNLGDGGRQWIAMMGECRADKVAADGFVDGFEYECLKNVGKCGRCGEGFGSLGGSKICLVREGEDGESEALAVCRCCLNLYDYEWGMDNRGDADKVVWGNGSGWAGGESCYASEGDLGTPLTVFDECHKLKGSLLNLKQVEINVRWIEDLCWEAGLKFPAPPVMNQEKLFMKWVQDTIEVCMLVVDDVQNKIIDHSKIEKNPLKKLFDANRTLTRLENTLSGLKQVDESWVYQPFRGDANTKTGKRMRIGDVYKVALGLSNAQGYGDTCLWRYLGNTLCMSATICDFAHFALKTGLEKSRIKWDMVRVGSDWDKWRGPIFRVKLDVVKRGGKRESWHSQPIWLSLIEWLEWWIDKYPNERTLVHSGTYELAEAVEDWWTVNRKDLLDRLFVHRKGMSKSEVDGTIEGYLGKVGGIIVSPICIEGLDWVGDKCRNIIFLKVPWMDKSDKRIEKEMETASGRRDYLVETVLAFIQGAGRGWRGSIDWVRTLVLDGVQLEKLLAHKGLYQKKFLERIRPFGDFTVPWNKDWSRLEKEKREPS